MNAHRHTVTGWPEPRPPAHADRPWPAVADLAGYVAAALALLCVLVGAAAWLEAEGPARSTPTSANLITVTPSADTSVPTR